MSETQERKANFTKAQKGLYEDLERVIGDWMLNVDIDEPEIQEVLYVMEDEWLDVSSEVLKKEEANE